MLKRNVLVGGPLFALATGAAFALGESSKTPASEPRTAGRLMLGGGRGPRGDTAQFREFPRHEQREAALRYVAHSARSAR